ncbi:hypothetical protein [Streptomyces sp. NBC_00572]|uniref:hypothetical protein n=1 Tax=Streptomyces sp. NBC_00572 TaxID=2903664 RepID=UPI00224DBF9A|nr:hypothetical protein [Streptomyces sp. NBC_00572]MCX4985492.1 hypothetical protein [Streptomyces sp. NBC_00572]
MADTVHSLIARLHELLVTHLTDGGADIAPGLHDVVARGAALGPDGAWIVAAGHANLSGMALLGGQADRAVAHLEAAVAAGYNDCVALHAGPSLPLHQGPRFRALYQRMRITQDDFDELIWLHQEMRTAVREAQDATVDNIGRLDTGVSPLPQAPLPTREPHTQGVLATRVDLAALQTALQRAALKAEFQRSSGNTSLDLIDGSWDHPRARFDAWHADASDTRRQRAAQARAFVERPSAGSSLLAPCPPLGSITYPA